MKIDLSTHLERAQKSKWALRKLNLFLGIGIPFNKPHKIKIVKVESDAIVTGIPLKRNNLNHIKGIHACGLATTAEFCSGLVLLRRLDPKKYRLIMQKIEVEYHYQAKKKCTARYRLDDAAFELELKKPLEKNGVVFYTCQICVHDEDQNLVATAHTRWQIKTWSKVSTKTD